MQLDDTIDDVTVIAISVVIDCGVELHQGFQATPLPVSAKAKMFVHPLWKIFILGDEMFTAGKSRPILLMQILYNAVKILIFFKCDELR